MSDKPSYIGTLNVIVNGERRAWEFLDAWSRVTGNQQIRRMLHTVALREAEHAASFEKRINELGFEATPTEDDDFARTLQIATSNLADAEKFEQLGVGQPREDDGDDRLLQLLADRSIDPQTAALLGRFIAEERDSVRLLEQAYAAACGARLGAARQDTSASDEEQSLTLIRQQLAELTATVGKLGGADS